ncbi:uncharacterized protein ARMOST_08148 [Armillaria ostoyae]|uniref:DUF6535 domain-containing protein n=1 Tax=Armillaria ostoyae TaxID=47428 RepID=A0A284R7S7_ARMOS|nr:uncharacterized protein ARMOST_08148 [Armillaria ostoyae]
MSTPDIDRTSTLDPGQEEDIVREDAEVEEPGIGGDGEHAESPAAREVLDSDSDSEDVESDEEEKEDQAPAAPPPTSANAKKIFGMKRSNPTVRKGNDTYDYEQKYPEDAPYKEAAPAARVWRTYEDESRNHDANMVEESRDNVDVLLVFAGLFSAVVTTFVVQTSQSLQADYAAMSASLLYETVLIQRAIANGSPVNSISPSPLNPTIAFVPATTDVWVNGLWFTSLFLSLTTALVAVLVKQWLHHYVALPSGTPRDRSFTRQFRYAGFQKWHVQVIIGLLPVLMHLALAIFLSGLVIFLHPLRAALSWIICAGTILVYTAYVVATILPILFPQCPYRTPLCDLVYVSLRRIVPRVTWSQYCRKEFLSLCIQRDFSAMFHYRPRVQARNSQSLTIIESKFVGQMSINLAAEALHWLFSASSNPTVQSIVIQSTGGLPMASGETFLSLQGDTEDIDGLQWSLVHDCLQWRDSYWEPVPGMELKLGRLLRCYTQSHVHEGCGSHAMRAMRTIAAPDKHSFELTAAILCSSDYDLRNGETSEVVRPGAFFIDIISSSKLPPRCWYHLMINSNNVFSPLDPDNDDHTNKLPLQLCFAIVDSFNASRKGVTKDFDSSLVLDFRHSVPYFLDKIYHLVLPMYSNFVKDPSLEDPSLPQSLRVFVAVIKFMLHRLSLPQYRMSYSTIRPLAAAVEWFPHRTLSTQEASAVMMVLEDILAPCVVPPLNSDSDWVRLCNGTFLAYRSLTTITPSACSLRGLRSMVDFMTSQWDQTEKWGQDVYKSDPACRALTDLLAKRVPVAYTAFLENQCLQFLGNHTFHEASVPMVSAYVAGISAMQHRSDGAVDEATHFDYLHNPQNLFTVCTILATHGFRNIDRTAIHRDITRLVQLCPRDAAWDECRRKLRDLVQGDGVDFFSEQRVRSESDRESYPLQPNEIQVEKDNIRYAIHVLDDFFDGGAHTIMGRLDRFLGWCPGRKLKDKAEQEQQV